MKTPFFPLALATVLLSAAQNANAQNANAQNANAQASEIRVSPLLGDVKLRASSPQKLDEFSSQPVVLRADKGEWENFQFVIENAGAAQIESLEIAPTRLVSSRGASILGSQITIYRQNFVRVAKPSGNKIVARKWWPDALLPLDLAPKTVEANGFAAFWGSIGVPVTADSGDYFGEIDIALRLKNPDGTRRTEKRRLALGLQVENRLVPPPKIRASVALYYDTLRDWYRKAKIEFSEAQWAAQKRRFYEFLLDYRLNAYDLPVDWKSETANRFLQDGRVLGVRVPPLDSPHFEAARAKLAATGTLGKAFYYWIDEPQTPADFARVRETSRELRALGIKHLVTVHPTQSLENDVDIWAPNIGDFFGIGHLSAQKLAQQREKGRETWFYTMVEQKNPYPTWLLDDESRAILDYAEVIARYNLGGFVYSMCHGWGENPLQNLESFAGTNGDGTLLYPAELVGGSGPLPSIRLMLLRDALENAERLSGKIEPLRASALLAGNDLPTEEERWNSRRGAAIIDGDLNEWSARERLEFASDARFEKPHTSFFVRNDGDTIYVGARAQGGEDGDWLAIELAPEPLAAHDEGNRAAKWRLVATRAGNVVAQKSTREGQSREEINGFRAVSKTFDGFYNAEFAIPRALLENKGRVRFNVLRRLRAPETDENSNSETELPLLVTRAAPDGIDPFLMPILQLAPANRVAKTTSRAN